MKTRNLATCCVLLLFSAILGCGQVGAQGTDATTDSVVFSSNRAAGSPGLPPLYHIMVSIDGEDPRCIFSVERAAGMSASKRADIIVSRLAEAWNVVQNRWELADSLGIIKNTQYNVYVMAPTNGLDRPTHIVQADGILCKELSETNRQALWQILYALRNDLRKIDLSKKPPMDKNLEDQKQISRELLAMATMATDRALAERSFTHAITCNPENVTAYEYMAAFYSAQDPAKEAAVRAVLDQKLKPALVARQAGDAAWDEGKYGDALAKYQEASKAFPECATYYWLRSMACERLGQQDKAIAALNEALALPGNTMVISSLSIAARGGDWTPMVEARIARLKAVK